LRFGLKGGDEKQVSNVRQNREAGFFCAVFNSAGGRSAIDDNSHPREKIVDARRDVPVGSRAAVPASQATAPILKVWRLTAHFWPRFEGNGTAAGMGSRGFQRRGREGGEQKQTLLARDCGRDASPLRESLDETWLFDPRIGDTDIVCCDSDQIEGLSVPDSIREFSRFPRRIREGSLTQAPETGYSSPERKAHTAALVEDFERIRRKELLLEDSTLRRVHRPDLGAIRIERRRRRRGLLRPCRDAWRLVFGR
jgi:hypothetical protein